nr:MAG: BhlA holin family protein [Bacteriophage sp.]
MEELAKQLLNLGAIGMIAFKLFGTVLEEKKEDRALYKQSVETFTDVSKAYADNTQVFAENISNMTVRVENLEEVTERTENKMDTVINMIKESK